MRPWWSLRPRETEEEEVRPDDWVRVPTRFDPFGQPCGWIWCAPEAAAQWDATRWRSTPPI